MRKLLLAIALILCVSSAECKSACISAGTAENVIEKLSLRFPAETGRIISGVKQAGRLWTEKDGTARQFEEFCLKQFVPGKDAGELFSRFETKMEYLRGYFTALERELSRELSLDTGPLLPADTLFAAYQPSINISEDLFRTKLAFVILLNYPVKILDDYLRDGPNWTR